MSAERSSHDKASHPAAPLLAALGREEAAERSADQELERAARFAARIDEQLESLTGQRPRSSRAAPLALSLAAALPLAWFAAHALQGPQLEVAIGREPSTNSATSARAAQDEHPVRDSLPARAASAPSEPKSSVRSSSTSSSNSDTLPEIPTAVSSQQPAPSTLGAENQLFSAAVNSARAGDVERALAGFEQLLHEYPSSPLSQTALVREFRLLAKLGRQNEATAQAKRFLRAYPMGFGAGEAEAIIRGAPSAGDVPERSSR